MTLQTDDMDLAGDVIQSLASYLGIEVYTAVNCVVMATPGGTIIHSSAETIFEYPCNYVIGPHVMFHMSRSYSMVSSSKSMPLRSPVWEYLEIVGEKKVRWKLCAPATTTLCVCVCACVCVCLRACTNYSLFDR